MNRHADLQSWVDQHEMTEVTAAKVDVKQNNDNCIICNDLMMVIVEFRAAAAARAPTARHVGSHCALLPEKRTVWGH